MRHGFLSFFMFFSVGGLCFAGDLKIYPTEIILNGPRAVQNLIVVEEEAGKGIADRTAEVQFSLANPKLAVISPDQTLVPLADGETTLTATGAGKSTTVKIKIQNFTDKTPPSFRNDVIPILTRAGCNSGACHGALAGKGSFKLSLRGYDAETDHYTLTKQAIARRIDRETPSESLLLLKGARKIAHGGGTKLKADSRDYQIIKEWIEGGAKGLSSQDSRLVKIEVYPKHLTLKPKDTGRLLVLAHYSDGTVRDVTRWAKFSGSEDQVAQVDEDGTFKVMGHGEAGLSAVYDNRVSTMVVTVPFANVVDAGVYKTSPRNNFIDEHILKKLQQLSLPPSPQCNDAEFIRRAYLDTCGILPTPEEVQAFVADTRPNKRAELINQLLNRPEFVDYWSYIWSDLFLVSSRKLPQPAVWAFYRSLRQSVADNTPWDKLATQVLTSSGSTLQKGFGNYFVLHKEIPDLVESTAVTFLGMSITCARCHNHPLEKWTQDQYWSMASLFSRVGLKNGERNGEVIIRIDPEGETLHPRLGIAMPPTPLDGKAMPAESTEDRRAYFAKWLTSPENPYFAKAVINRVWKNFMGRGLVEADDDLRETNPPSNPELFDALAADFIKNGYDLKRLMNLILNSAAYQRSSVAVKGNQADDRFYSRYLVKRLSAEVLLDAISQVTGVATPFDKLYTGVEGGTTGINLFPEGTRALQLPDSRVASKFLDAFGRADRQQTCSCERSNDSTVGQALMLNNGQILNDKIRSTKWRGSAWLKEELAPEEAVKRVYQLALSRDPNENELKKLTTMLKQAGNTPQERREVMEDLFWAVLTSREFMFNH